jgi:hypothetical protein
MEPPSSLSVRKFTAKCKDLPASCRAAGHSCVAQGEQNSFEKLSSGLDKPFLHTLWHVDLPIAAQFGLRIGRTQHILKVDYRDTRFELKRTDLNTSLR